METIKNITVKKCRTFCLMAMLFLCAWFTAGSHAEAKQNRYGEILLYNFSDSPEVKKTKDGFYYTMDSEKIMDQLELFFPKKGKQYKKLEKKYKGKTNYCYILAYLGKEKNIRLPEEIEGCSNYVLCFSYLDGRNGQVKNVTIPQNANIKNVMYDNPYCYAGEPPYIYYENKEFDYKFSVEKGNRTMMSKKGLLYSNNGKVLYGIPTILKGKFVIPDSVEEVHVSDYLKISELVFGKKVSKIFLTMCFQYDLRKISIKKGNRYFKEVDNIVYSKDMKRIYFSIPGKTGTYQMPDSVERMEERAFDDTNYSKIITSDRLKNIPRFSMCSHNLKELVIGKSVSRISKDAVNFGQLKKITVSEKNPNFMEWKNHLYNKDRTKFYF